MHASVQMQAVAGIRQHPLCVAGWYSMRWCQADGFHCLWQSKDAIMVSCADGFELAVRLRPISRDPGRVLSIDIVF